MIDSVLRTAALLAAFALSLTTASAQSCRDYKEQDECESRTELDPRSERVYACTWEARACTRGADLGRGPSIMVPPVALGSLGPRVRLLQANLARSGAQVTVDSKFGPQTKAAVEAYQKQQGLKVDGKVGVETWQKLSK